MQPLHWKLIVCYSNHDLNSKLLVCYSRHGLNYGPFDERTISHDRNSKLVCYSDPHCTSTLNLRRTVLTSFISGLVNGEIFAP